MDINRFTEKVQQALSAAQTKTVRYGHQQIDVEHLLAALLEQERGLAKAICTRAEVNTDTLQQRVEQELGRLPKVASLSSGAADQIYVTGRLNRLLAQAEDEAVKLHDEFISVEHLLLAMTDDTGTTGRLFRELGITCDRLMRTLQEVRGSQRVISQNPEAAYEALERYGRDLTKLAAHRE
jgi:ATP-dependent Clp protease ATP-binding subunit ClpB